MAGTWYAAKHWWGWAITFASEGLWLAYGLHTHDQALVFMAVVWATIAARNTHVTRKAQA